MGHITFPAISAFSDNCLSATKPEDITEPLSELLAGQGIRSWFVGSLGYINESRGFGFDQIPEGWRKRYVEQRYYTDDPVFHHARRGGKKCSWAEARRAASKRGTFKRARQVSNEAAEFELTNGLIMPVHGFGDLPGAVTYGGDDLDLSDDAQASLYLVGAFAYEWLRRIEQKTKPVPPVFTVKELQVLRWTAEGKSATDIAVILNLSRFTVQEYHKRIRSKYGVSKVIQAVVIAAVDGQLNHAATL